ncbi:DUF2500 domain-containing protein [Paenibacillus sp. Soil750]|uniref:DUF2500 domain-containing protein n=1 Tax=Paenibacillus sp. Soil750 TaxID=1736398 RepID=UPI0009EA3C5B|nr:DUF2500 domain-containing protein [Paenibacillus sp. Soil750]
MSMGFDGPPFIFKAMFVLIPLLIIGMIIFAVISGINTWARNNASPVLRRDAIVITKRTKVWGGSEDSSASTSYFVTFEFDDRSRLELQLSGSEYGLIAEGDRGKLTNQGTRFNAFQR